MDIFELLDPVTDHPDLDENDGLLYGTTTTELMNLAEYTLNIECIRLGEIIGEVIVSDLENRVIASFSQSLEKRVTLLSGEWYESWLVATSSIWCSHNFLLVTGSLVRIVVSVLACTDRASAASFSPSTLLLSVVKLLLKNDEDKVI